MIGDISKMRLLKKLVRGTEVSVTKYLKTIKTHL